MTIESKAVEDRTVANAPVEVDKVEKFEREQWVKQNDFDCSDETCDDQATTDPEDDDSSSHEQCDDEPVPGLVAVSSAVKPVSPTYTSRQEPAACDANENIVEVFSKENTVFIFDWDDTCLPSAWVSGQGLTLNEESIVSESQLQELDEAATVVANTLALAKRYGTVVLVTNAEKGWIELSCRKFLPNLWPSLADIKIVSARTTYESVSLSSPLDWKVCAFKNELKCIFGEKAATDCERRKNVLSLGDSMHEREALLRTTAPLPNCCSKSMKFVERPNIGQICKQHSLVTGCFERIVQHDGNLDLCIRCS